MLTKDGQIYKTGSLLELAKKNLAAKNVAISAQNQRASSLMTNPYTKVSTPYEQLPAAAPEPTLGQKVSNFVQPIKEHGVFGTAAEGGRVAGGFIGDILGKITGGAIGAIVGGISGPATKEILKAPNQGSTPAIIKQEDPLATRVQEVIKTSKDLYQKGGIAGRNLGAGYLSYLPQAIQNTIDIGKMSITDKGRNQFVNYAAQVLAGRDPENIQSPELARNLLLAGNDTGDLNNINKEVVRKAWFAALLPIFQDIWITSTLATSAYNGYYAKNPIAGYKPSESIKIDFNKGIAELVKKDQFVRTEIFKPKEGVTGSLEITKGTPTIGRTLATPITELGKPLVRSQYTPNQARLEASNITPPDVGPTQTAAVGGALEAPKLQLPEGTGKPVIPIVNTPQSEFQMVNPKANKVAAGLAAKLQTVLDAKQKLASSGRATADTIKEVKILQNTIAKLSAQVEKARAKGIIAMGPIKQGGGGQISTPMPPAEQASTAPIAEKTAPKVVKPTVTPEKRFINQDKKIKTLERKLNAIEGEVVKEPIKILYHGSNKGGFRIDRNGNINLGSTANEVKQFGEPIALDVSGMKVKSFPTKEDLFNAVQNKGAYQRAGYDILTSGNHSLAINPKKFAKQLNLPSQDIRKLTVGGEMKRYEKTLPKQALGRPKIEGTITQKEATQTDREVRAKIRETKSYEDYLAKAPKEVSKETPEQIHERLVAEKEAVAARRASGKFTSQERALGIRPETIKANTEKIAKREYQNQIAKWKVEGKNSDFFMKKYQEEFDKGTNEGGWKSDLLFDVMQNQPGFINTTHLFDMLTLKPVEKAINEGIEKGLTWIYKKIGGPQLMESLKNTLQKSELVNKFGRAIIYRYQQPQWFKDLSEAADRGIIKAGNVAEEMTTYLEKGLSNAEKIELQEAIINGGYHSDPKIGDRAAVARSVLDDYGEQFYRAGAMSRETFEKNKGTYLLRAYYNYELKDPVTSFFKNVGGYKAGLERAKKRGIEKIVSENQAQDLIRQGWEDRGPVKSRPGHQRVWRDFTKEERKAMDEILDAPSYLVAKSIKQVGYDVSILNKFLEVSNHPDVVKGIPFQNFVKLPDNIHYGALRDKYVAPWLANDIKGIMEARSTARDIGDTLLSQWKQFKVTLNPSGHFRNMYWNWILTDIAGASFHRIDLYGPAFMDVVTKSNWYVRAKNANTFGTSSWAGAELGKVLEKNQKLKIQELKKKADGSYDIDWKDKFGSNFLEILGKLKNGYESFEGNAAALYQGEEEWNKMVLFRHAVQDLGMDDNTAAKFAKKWGLDYGAVTPTLANFSKKWYGMPFLRFQAKVAPLLIEASFTRMASIAKWILTFYFLQDQARKKLGLTEQQLKDIKQKVFPAWMKKGLYIPYPAKDKYGQYQFLDLSYIVPLVDNMQSFNPLDYSFQNPLYRIPSELFFNKSLFTDNVIIDKQVNPEWNKIAKAYLKYTYQQIMPSIAPGGLNFEKVKNAIIDSRDKTLEQKGLQLKTISSTLIDVIFGLKLRTFDITQQQSARLSELKKENDAYMAELRNVYIGQGTNRRITEEDKVKRMKEVINHIQNIMLEAADIQGMDTTGIK